jgi:hypothetical protein
LIKYFFEKANSEISSNWNEKLKFIPFIYAKGKTLRPPRNICFPTNSDLTELEKEIKVIHTQVYNDLKKNQEIIDWLKVLGVTEVSEIKWLENEIIPYLYRINYKDDHHFIINSIFKLHKTGLEEWHYSKLRELKLLCTNKEFHVARCCYFSNYYLPEIPLEGKCRFLRFVSKEYCKYDKINKTDFKSFLLKIGVSEDIDLKTYNSVISWNSAGDYQYRAFIDKKYDDNSNNWKHHGGGLVSDPHGFKNFKEFSLMDPYHASIDFYKIFWNRVLTKYSEQSNIFDNVTLFHGYNQNHVQHVKSYILWFAETQYCIPTSLKELKKSKDVFLNTKDNKFICGHYLPVFDSDIQVNSIWSEVFKFKREPEYFDLLQLLFIISKEDMLHKYDKERISLIYNDLSNKLSILTTEQRREIEEWATKNKLLSTSETFENTNDLKYIKNKSFTNSSEQFKQLFIPDNCNTESENFDELLSLFGIQVIDKFIPEIKDAELNATLKIQLQIILPYLVALIENKQYANFADEYKRISEIVDITEFYNASEINLSFKNQDEKISGPSLNAYLGDNQLYFKGKWTSPLTLYALVPELVKLIEIKSLNEEFNLILQLDENEIKEWFSEQGFELSVLQEKPEYSKSLEKVKSYTSEDDIEQSYDLVDNSDERSRISISQDAKETIFNTLKTKGFHVPDTLDINYTVVNGIKNPKSVAIKIVVKSGKAGKTYFNPNEWLALTDANTQLFIVTRGNIVRNVTLNDLEAFNDTFHMRFNTQSFAVNTNLKAFANFFRYLPYTHFIFDTPVSTTDYLQEFGLNQRNPSADTLTSDDKNLLH